MKKSDFFSQDLRSSNRLLSLRHHKDIRYPAPSTYSKQKEFKAIKNSIIREADRLRLELEQEEMDSTNPYTNEESGEIDSTETPPKTDSAQQPIKSPAVNNHNPAVIAAVTRLLYHMGQIFRDNAMAPTSPLGLRIDSKRRKKLMAKRLALGHKADDHEEQGWQNGPSM